VTQSNAVYSFIGKRLNLNGRGDDNQTANDEILCQAKDLRDAVVGMCYGDKGKFSADMKKHLTAADGGGATNYNKFEGYLKQRGTAFFAGSKPCSGDFHVWEMLDQHEMMCKSLSCPSLLAKYPLLTAYYEKFKALPQLESYFASDAYKLPVNAAVANFK
jgi:glutathione S-transferase